jgi:regulator of sigma E protease
MMFFLYTAAFLIVVSILIIVHEFGHFLVARLFQVRVERFSIGFGKPLYVWRSKNKFTEYRLSPFIFGGYVKLLDTRETHVPVSQQSFAFDRKPILQRIAVISAGPLANVIFAFFAFWLMFVIGFKLPKPIVGKVVEGSIASNAGMHIGEEVINVDGNNTDNWGEVVIAMLARVGDNSYLNIATKSATNRTKTYRLDLSSWRINSYDPEPLLDFGLEQYQPPVLPVIYEIASNSPAEHFGLQQGDRIIAVAGKKTSSWKEFLHEIKLYPKQSIHLLIKRGSRKINFPITTDWKFGKGWKKIGFIGAAIDETKIIWPEQTLRSYKYNIFSAIPASWHQIKTFITMNNIIFSKLLTGKMSSHILGGSIATFMASGQALEHGFITFLDFLAIISLAVAFINILPLPGLDGGYLLLFLIEAIRRRPISIRLQTLIIRLGLILLVLLVLQTTANDLIRMFV